MSSQFPDLGVSAPTVTASEVKRRLDTGESVTILDTRRSPDFEAWQLDYPGVESVNVPFTAFLDGDGPVETLPEEVPDSDPEGSLVINCAKGISSQFVGNLLVREGRDVEVLADGMEGWARLYEAREVEVEAPATVVQYHRPSSGCLAYVLVDGDEAAVIDPLRAFADRYVEDARERGATLRYAVDTHVHADHVSGTRAVAARSDAEVVVPEGARDRGLDYDDYRAIADGDTLQVGDATLDAVALPGHTTEMVGYRVGDCLVSGDTVFTDAVGRPDLETGEEGAREAADWLYDTIQKIGELPDDTVIAPGHTSTPHPSRDDGTFTARLGDLRADLWAFSADRGTFVDRTVSELGARPSNYRRIVETNLGRAAASDEEAFGLELGPNNCAAAPADD